MQFGPELEEHRAITAGIGNAGVSCDGEVLWTEADTAPITVGWVERVASVTPEQDWRIWFRTPSLVAEYQRQPDGRWVLVGTQRRSSACDEPGMFTDIDLECPVRVAGIPLLLIAQWQRGRLRWALCSDYAALWSGWAGDA